MCFSSRLVLNPIRKPGLLCWPDRKAKVPYLYNASIKRFVSYDDEQSVKAKCRYVKKEDLAGVMFWEYFSDPNAYLLGEIEREL